MQKGNKILTKYQIYNNDTGRAYLEPFFTYADAEYMATYYGPTNYIIVEIESEGL